MNLSILVYDIFIHLLKVFSAANKFLNKHDLPIQWVNTVYYSIM